MEYSKYTPALPDVQAQVIQRYQELQGVGVVDKKKKKNWTSLNLDNNYSL